MKKIKVCVVDDQPDILRSAEILFKGEGIECVTCDSPVNALNILSTEQFDLILLDLNYQSDTTSGQEGIDLITAIRQTHSDIRIVVMTAWASVNIAVEVMKQGANDFVIKPWSVDRLLNIVNTQVALGRSLLHQHRLEDENQLLREALRTDLIFASAAMQSIIKTFEQISDSDAQILITGANGTGKSKLAHFCHQMSCRAKAPFISVNMGGLAESVFESEMFGHKKGAFTGADKDRIGRYELADGGTLFLDEIANLSEKNQATLLRLLESGEFERLGCSNTRKAHVRIISATNADLPDLIKQGKFRQDLYYRINTIPIHIPPLQDRPEDIPVLADSFVKKYTSQYQKLRLSLSPEAESALVNYSWPGNVRELEHCIQRAVILNKGETIIAKDLGLSSDGVIEEQDLAQATRGSCVFDNTDEKTLAEMEYMMLENALIKYIRKPEEAAKALGISRSAFYRKLAKYGFEMS